MANHCGLPLLRICDHRTKACGSSRRVPERLGAIPRSCAVLELIAPGAQHRDTGRWSSFARELRFEYGGIVNASCRLDGCGTKPWSGSVTTVCRKGPMSSQRHRRSRSSRQRPKSTHSPGPPHRLSKEPPPAANGLTPFGIPRGFMEAVVPGLRRIKASRESSSVPGPCGRRQRAGSCLASSSAQRA